MLNVLESEIINEIMVSFTGVVLAIFSAGVIWFLRSAYEKHKAEVLALAKFERIFATNLTLLKDNFEFTDKWIESLSQNRPYSFRFQEYLIGDEGTYKISNLNLINQILSINYKLKRTSLDLDNIYKSYWDIISEINSVKDDQKRTKDLRIYHKNVQQVLQQIKQNYKPLKSDLINVIALIRVVYKIRRHSLFGYMSFLFLDIFPRVTKKAVAKQILFVKNNMKKQEKTR